MKYDQRKGSAPRVSIGLPVYNGERYLEPAMESLLAQTFSDFELIVCDNASTDGSREIAERYAREDDRVKVCPAAENKGAIWNHNRAVDLARGEYFKWAAHDDVYEPRFVERCVDVLDADKAAVLAFSRTRFIDEEGNALEDYSHPLDLANPLRAERFLQYVGAAHILVEDYGVVRRDVLMKTRLLGTYAWSDMVLLGELSLYGSFIEVPEILFFRRLHPGRAMQAYGDPKSLTAFNDPKRRNKRIMPTWRIFGAHLRSLARVPLSFSERITILWGIARRANWLRRALVSELFTATLRKSV